MSSTLALSMRFHVNGTDSATSPTTRRVSWLTCRRTQIFRSRLSPP